MVVPTEHGGWGFTLEPVLLGALAAPGWPALGLGIATFAAFLARRPLRLGVADLRRHRRLDRTRPALMSVAVFAGVALGGVSLAWAAAVGAFWWPVLIAVPMVLMQLRYDLSGRGRELLPELLGPAALGAAAPMIILAEGLEPGLATGAWVVLTARLVPSVLMVRAQLRRAKGQSFSPMPAHVTGLLSLAAVVGAAALGWVPWLSVGAAVAVAVWDAVSLGRPPVAARTIGWTQMLVGTMVAVSFALGFHTGW